MSPTTIVELNPIDPERRRFTLLDLMILIAAIGLMLIVPRAFDELTSIGDGTTRALLSFHSWMRMTEAVMILGSAALIVLLLASPKNSRPGRFQRPGTIALVVVLLTCLFEFLQNGFIVFENLRNNGSAIFWAYNLAITPVRLTGSNAIFAISGSWLTLKIIGRFEWGRDWLDHCAFLLSSIWILWGIAHPFLTQRFP